MSFLRAKKFTNKKKDPRTYYYIVKNHRPNKKNSHKQIIIDSLGRFDNSNFAEKQLLDAYPQYAGKIRSYFSQLSKRHEDLIPDAQKALKKAKHIAEETLHDLSTK